MALLFSLTSAALLWNVGTWYFGLPCSSSDAIIGAILGIAIVHALAEHAVLRTAVDWREVRKVGEALIFSPLAGLILASLLFWLLRRWLPDPHLYAPPEPGQPPVARLRVILILTSTGVSFAHGLNDGQKNIGLIMLTIIGLTPLQHAINLDYPSARLPQLRDATARLDELLRGQPVQQKPPVATVLASAHYLHQVFARISAFSEIPPPERRRVRAAVYQIDELIKLRLRSQPGDARQRLRLQQSRALLLPVVQYVPAWVRLLSAACLGLGTMIGYRRIVHTPGERIGTAPLTTAQGACTKLAGAGLITLAARFGLPVSTTHIVASGIAGTMISQGDQVQNGILRQIALAWLLTLPATLVLAACLFYGLS